MRPVIFVGCGGSGMNTLRSIHDLLSLSLQDVGAGSVIPDAFQFMVIDVPRNPQVKLPDRISYENLANDQTLWMGPNGVDPTLAGHPNRDRKWDYLDWRTDPNGMEPLFEEGAGQFRALGRAVGVRSMDAVGTEFKKMAQKAIRAQKDLPKIAEKFGFPASSDSISSPMVVVISSLGGGAGSGIFLDVCESIRVESEGELVGLQQNLVAVVYDPSVFAEIRGKDGGIPGNSYAALMELVASNVHSREASPHLTAGNARIGRMNGPQQTFVVGVPGGSRAAGMDTIESVYRSTARTISAWVLNPSITKSFGTWLGNWDAVSLESKSLVVEQANGVPVRMPTSAFGYARLDLGRGRLQRFIIENAVKLGINNLLTKYKELDPEALTIDDQYITNYVGSNMDLVFNFLKDAGLNEHTDQAAEKDDNDILDGIRLSDLDERLRKLADDVCSDFNNYKNLINLEQNIEGQIVRGQLKDIKTEHERAVLVWAKTVQAKFAWAVVKHLAIHGIHVFEKILESSVELHSKTFPGQLTGEKTTGHLQTMKDSWGKRGSQEAFKGKNTISSRHKTKIQELVKDRLEWQVEQDLRDVAEKVCIDVAQNLLKPALTEIQRNKRDLEVLVTNGEDFARLSDSTGPGDHLLPTANEILIESIEGWPATMQRLLRESGTDLNRLSSQFVTCEYHDKELLELQENSHLKPWTSSQEWIPNIGTEHGLGARQPLKIRFEMSLESVLARAYGYFTRVGANQPALARYCQQSISGYLQAEGDSEAERDTRVASFCEDLKRALEKSEPLAEVDWQRVERLYGAKKESALQKIISEIPLKKPLNDAISRKVASVLADYGVTGEDLFSSDSKNTYIEIFSSCAPMSPANFFSLSSSIVKARNEEDAKRKTIELDPFFRGRRSRPYDQFLPYAPAVRVTAARGWIIGLLTGRIDLPCNEEENLWGVVLRTAKLNEAIYVTNAQGGRKKLLFHPVGQYEESDSKFREVALLTSVLNSGLMAEMMSVVQADSEEFDAFQEVVRLGFGDKAYAHDDFSLGNGVDGPLVRWLRESGGRDVNSIRELITATANLLQSRADELVKGRTSWFESQIEPTEYSACPYEFLVAELYAKAARQIAKALTDQLAGIPQ